MKKYFIAGLLTWVPLVVTVLVLKMLLGFVDQVVAILPDSYQPIHWLGYNIPGLGLVLVVVVVWLTGALMANFVGRRMLALSELFLDKIPLVSLSLPYP